jgi:hypothetical protein
MRRLRSLVTSVPASMLFIVLAKFALESVRSGRYDVLGTTFLGSVWWIVMGSWGPPGSVF